MCYLIWKVPASLLCCWHSKRTLIRKKIKFSSYIRKFIREQLHSLIWLIASSYVTKYLRITSYIRKPFLVYDFATAPLWISLFMRKIWLNFFTSAAKKTFLHKLKNILIKETRNSNFFIMYNSFSFGQSSKDWVEIKQKWKTLKHILSAHYLAFSLYV